MSQNEQEVDALAQALGLQMPVINFGYRNHFLDEASTQELRARLVYIFRGASLPHPRRRLAALRGLGVVERSAEDRHGHHLQPVGSRRGEP